MAMSPGQYLRKCRERAGLVLDDVAIGLDTVPPVAASVRVAWLGQIEADIVPVPDGLAAAIVDTGLFTLDADVLDRLIDLYTYRAGLPEPRICRGCGCTHFDPCFETAVGMSCAWTAEDSTLCTACRPIEPTPQLARSAASVAA